LGLVVYYSFYVTVWCNVYDVAIFPN